MNQSVIWLIVLIHDTYDLLDAAVQKSIVFRSIICQIIHGDIVGGNRLCKCLAVAVSDRAAFCAYNNRTADPALELFLIGLPLDDLQSI